MYLRTLKGRDAFSSLFKAGKKISGRRATLFIRHSADAVGSSCAYFGIGLRRRTKPAVLRNRLKRLVRTALANIVAVAPASGEIRCVVVWYDIPSHPRHLKMQEVEAELSSLWQRAQKYMLAPREQGQGSEPATNTSNSAD